MHGANALLILPYQQADFSTGTKVEAILTGPVQETGRESQ
jgi:hypothetical protein